MERLQKVIANSGYTSRRKAEELISNGHVAVNGEVITTLGFKVSGSDIISIDGNIITKDVKKEYYLLNNHNVLFQISQLRSNHHLFLIHLL